MKGNLAVLELAEQLERAVRHQLIGVVQAVRLIQELSGAVELHTVEVKEPHRRVGIGGAERFIGGRVVVEQVLALTGHVDREGAFVGLEAERELHLVVIVVFQQVMIVRLKREEGSGNGIAGDFQIAVKIGAERLIVVGVEDVGGKVGLEILYLIVLVFIVALLALVEGKGADDVHIGGRDARDGLHGDKVIIAGALLQKCLIGRAGPVAVMAGNRADAKLVNFLFDNRNRGDMFFALLIIHLDSQAVDHVAVADQGIIALGVLRQQRIMGDLAEAHRHRGHAMRRDVKGCTGISDSGLLIAEHGRIHRDNAVVDFILCGKDDARHRDRHCRRQQGGKQLFHKLQLHFFRFQDTGSSRIFTQFIGIRNIM